jgi:hypothetical protein
MCAADMHRPPVLKERIDASLPHLRSDPLLGERLALGERSKQVRKLPRYFCELIVRGSRGLQSEKAAFSGRINAPTLAATGPPVSRSEGKSQFSQVLRKKHISTFPHRRFQIFDFSRCPVTPRLHFGACDVNDIIGKIIPIT